MVRTVAGLRRETHARKGFAVLPVVLHGAVVGTPLPPVGFKVSLCSEVVPFVGGLSLDLSFSLSLSLDLSLVFSLSLDLRLSSFSSSSWSSV